MDTEKRSGTVVIGYRRSGLERTVKGNYQLRCITLGENGNANGMNS